MQLRGLRKSLGVLAVTALIASGCAGGSSDDPEEPADAATDGQEEGEPEAASGEPQAGGTLVAAVAEDLDSTDPHRTSGETGPVWLSLMFETLVFVDGDAQVAPGLATDWEISDDGLTYTFNLRDDVVFHNGRELTSEDVKWNYERIQDPDVGAASAAVFGIVDEIETPDEQTLVMELNTPSGALLSDLALQGRVGIVAPESYDDAGEMSEFIGTGPFTYGSYTVNDRLVLERNEDYWGGAPNIETIEVRILPDGSSRLSALAAGEVDFAWNVPAEQASAMEADGNFSLQPFPQNRGNYFAINPNEPPFDDARVREAMHLAVSRDDLASTAWSGFAIPNDQPFEPSSFWYVERDTRTDADLDRARELLDEAGADSVSATILSWDAMGSDQEAQLIASAWEQIGISTSIEVVDIGTIVERGGSGNFDVLHLWVGLNLDPNRPYSFWEADSPRNPVVGNFSTPELDAVVKEGRATTDQDERKELYAEALDINEAEAGTFYTVSPQQFVGIGERLQGYEQGAFYVWYEGGGMPFAWIEE
jgi:peptide/nickel transport system substrate-binding protein